MSWMFKDLDAEHGECAKKIRVAEEQANLNLKAAEDVQREFDEFTKKVQALEEKIS